MFRSKGSQLLRAMTAGRLTAAAAVCHAIDGRHHAALAEIMKTEDVLNADIRAAVYGHVIARRDFECLQIMYEADAWSHQMTRARLRLLVQLDAAGWEDGLALVIRRREDDSIKELAAVLAQEMPDSVRNLLHEHHARWRPAGHLLYYACNQRPQDIPYYLSLVDGSGMKVDYDHALNQLLESAADTGLLAQMTDVLVGRMGERDEKKYGVMVKMLRRGLLAQAQAFIDAGFDFRKNSYHLCRTMREENAPEETQACLRAWMETPLLTGTYNGFTREGAESVACVTTFSSGQILTMVFNFATAQQILLVRDDKHIAPATAVAFSQIENRDILARAAEAFVKTGGDAALVAEIAAPARPMRIGKPGVKGGG